MKNPVTEISISKVFCKYCDKPDNVVKFGTYNGVQRYWCKNCDRTKIMRGMRNKQTAKLITDGWLVHYNFFRPHESLVNRTPAKVAGIGNDFPFKNWIEMIREW